MLEPLLKLKPAERMNLSSIEQKIPEMFKILETMNTNDRKNLPSCNAEEAFTMTCKTMYMNHGFSFNSSNEFTQKDSNMCWAFTTLTTFSQALSKFFGTLRTRSDKNISKKIYWDSLQVYIGCVQPRVNDGLQTDAVFTDVLGSHNQRAYLSKAVLRMVSPTILSNAGWKILTPIIDIIKKRFGNPNHVNVELKNMDFDAAKNWTRESIGSLPPLAVLVCKGSSIGKPSTACIIGRFSNILSSETRRNFD